MSVFSSKKATSWIQAITALMIVMICESQLAEASCGHLVGHQSALDNVRLLAALDEILPVTTLAPSQTVQAYHFPAQSIPSQPLPCSGTSCSSQVPSPIPTTVIQVQVFDHWGVIECRKELVYEPSRREWDDTIVVLYRGDSQSVFHPPRVLA
jgi:hypothetical protein